MALPLIAIGIGAYVDSLDFPEGAQLFPQLLASVAIVLAIIVLVLDLRANKDKGKAQSNIEPKRAYLTFGVSVLYMIGIQTIGFFVSSIVMSVALMGYFGIRKIYIYAAALICMLLFYYVLFDRFLHVPLPHGMLY